MRRKWADKQYKEQVSRNISNKLHDFWNDDLRSAELRKATSEIVSKQWEDEEHRRLYSEMGKERWKNQEYRDKIVAAQRSEEVVAKRSASLKKSHSRPETRAKLSAGVSAAWRRGAFDNVFLPISQLESSVVDYVSQLGLNYVSQYRPDGCKYVFDIYLPEYRMLIEVDGEFWHYSKWAEEHGRFENDEDKNSWAVSHNYVLVRLRESLLQEQGVGRVINNVIGTMFTREPAWRDVVV